MKKSASRHSSRTIGQKVLVALVLAIAFLIAAIYITRFTFSEVNESISRLSLTNEKNAALNKIYTTYGSFERSFQGPLIANPFADTDDYYTKLDSLQTLIDTTLSVIPFHISEVLLLDSIAVMLTAQEKNIMRYRSYKRMEQPLLQRNLDSLINLISAEEILREVDVVTTHKSTRIIPVEAEEDGKNKETHKKTLLQRIFGDKDKEEVAPKKPEAIEETYTQIDTVSLAKSDTSTAKAGTIIKGISQDQASQQRRVREVEMEIVQSSARIQNFILSMIRHVEEIEMTRIQNESEAASNRMQIALTQMYWILGVFAILATLLVLRILSDLSKAKFYRLQLVAEKDRAENLSKIKERFLANMSHEIRTPLQNILGYSEKLLSKDHNRDVEIIHQSSEHLLQIINQVLDFSRISTGKLTLNPTVVNLIDLFTEVVNSMSIQASRKNVRILFESEIAHKHIYIDPFRLRQILYNLLGNAVKFTDEGFIRLFAKTENRADGVHLFFTVEDTGIGMSDVELESVFQEFEQVGTPAHVTSGTGLGLSITKALVEAHDGTIQVKSEKDEGSIFSIDILLPSMPEHNLVEEKEIERPRMQTILVVDDDKIILDLTSQILTEYGFEVVAEFSPFKAIEVAEKIKFDMALVDFRMPEMSGAELRDKLKELHPDLPVVAVTANVFADDDAEQDSKHGFDGYLPKPYKSSELLEIVGYKPKKESEPNTSQSLTKKLEKLTFGDHALADELIEQFKSDCVKDIGTLEESLESMNMTEAHRMAHTLAGRLGFFEFDSLAAAYKTLENEIYNDSLSKQTLENLPGLNAQLRSKLDDI